MNLFAALRLVQKGVLGEKENLKQGVGRGGGTDSTW